MKCPKCKNDMEKDTVPMVYPYYCKKCNGYWSEKAVLDYIDKQKENK